MPGPGLARLRLVGRSVLSLTLGLAAVAGAQQDASGIGRRLLSDAAVRAAVDAAQRDEPLTLETQVRLCEIPAPPFGEAKRAAAVQAEFQALGLQNVRSDAVGNVLGERPGRHAHPHVVVAAHLDTVFPEATDVTVKRDGSILRGPGISDNCRGLAVMLAMIRALKQASLETNGTITFVANVGEEGPGNLRGVRHLIEKELHGRIDRFVSIDGSGIGFTHVGVGSRRYRVSFGGPGGHSYYSFGAANPIHALSRAVAKLAEFEVPDDPRTTFSVGRIGGGTSINSIAFEAWLEVDMRSHDPGALDELDGRFLQAIEEAVREENERWGGRGAIVAVKEDAGSRPAGESAAGSAIVLATISVTEALGLPVQPFPGSTDSNLPMSLGVPAVTLDGGGNAKGIHSLVEWFDSTDSWQGTQRALLLVVALTEP